MSSLAQTIRGLWPFGPIFDKELRQMARRKRTYFLRFAYLGLLLFVLFMCWLTLSPGFNHYYGYGRRSSTVLMAQRQAEMGRYFFVTFTIFSVVAMHLIGPVLTSTAIGSEKLRRTLDVLLMTPINAWQIVGGKLSSRMLTAVMLLGLTLPVLAIVRLLGGVEIYDLFGALSLAAATALASAAIGLWLSCYLQRAWAVILLSYLILAALYFVLPMLGAMFFSAYMRTYYTGVNPGGPPAGIWTLVKCFFATHPVATASFLSAGGNGTGLGLAVSWWPAVFVQLGMAVLLTLMSARVVRKHAKRERGESTGLVTPMPPQMAIPVAPDEAEAAVALPPPLTAPLDYQKAGGFDRPAKKRRPVGDRPIVWYELRRPLLARNWQRILATTLTLALLGIGYLGLALNNDLHDDDTQIGFAFIFHGLLFLISIVLSATAIATEKESDTWTLLIASPLSGAAIVGGKFLGVLRRLLWPSVLMVAHFTLFLFTGVLSPMGMFITFWVTFTFILPWIATGLYFSLTCRRVTTAVVLNLLLPVVVYGVTPLVLLAVDTLITRPGESSRDLSELVLYYIPWYYLGEGLDRFDWHFNWSDTIWMHGQITFFAFIQYMVLAGTIQVVLTALILWGMSARFDRIVGRARG